ncbi:guanylate kinase [Glaciecola sp. MH2013]|uniref:guanylate kinase n=1 Tax=Glaciecola sp. MH2013 TaxID=2785524 RepID=UPI0018A11B81|nr:guanylate kinase [Glaciecola sp. MH2013]MBF7073521.1 guanylate kinase [Glaciecola sp. MH2013]
MTSLTNTPSSSVHANTTAQGQSAYALGNLFIVAAPSGAGKSTLIKSILAKSTADQPMQLSVSHTTRKPRPGEVNGVDYHFVDHAQFESMIAADAFYEYAEVFGNYYGTSKEAISDKLGQGVDIFLDIDWQGARQIKKQNASVVGIFIVPPSIESLRERLTGRGQDSEEVIAGRMAEAKSEMSHYDEFDFVVVNDDLEKAKDNFECIVKSCRNRLAVQKIRHNALFEQLLSEK